MQTILFLLPTSITVRNFLFTGVLDLLVCREDIRVVAVAPEPPTFEHFLKKKDRLVIESFPYSPVRTVSDVVHGALRRRFYKIKETSSMKILSKIRPLRPSGIPTHDSHQIHKSRP